MTSSRSPRLPVFSTLPCRPAARAASFRPRSALAVMRMAGVGTPWRRSSRTRSVPRPSGSRWSTSSRSAPRRASTSATPAIGGRRAAHAVARAAERRGHPVAHDGVVVHEQDADLLAAHVLPIRVEPTVVLSPECALVRTPGESREGSAQTSRARAHGGPRAGPDVRCPGTRGTPRDTGRAPPRAAASAARRRAARRPRPGSAGPPRPAGSAVACGWLSTCRRGDCRHSAATPSALTASPSSADTQ